MFDEQGTRYLDCINNVATGKSMIFLKIESKKTIFTHLFCLRYYLRCNVRSLTRNVPPNEAENAHSRRLFDNLI
jgi:hypothetical protein